MQRHDDDHRPAPAGRIERGLAPAGAPGSFQPAPKIATTSSDRSEPTAADVRARHVRVDTFSAATLLLELPMILFSLALMGGLGEGLGSAIGHPGIGSAAVLVLWLTSGVLIFHAPVETFLARLVLRARRPLPAEKAQLEPLWESVTRTAGVPGGQYQLWITDSNEINASAVSGHIVTVTRAALQVLPPRELASVLAHELGHHLGGHAGASMLAYWYSVPARILTRLAVLVVRLIALVTAGVLTVALAFTRLGPLAGLLFYPLIVVVGGMMLLTYSPLILMVVLPLMLLRLFDRYGELRADRTAVELGYGHDLLRVFEIWQAQGLGGNTRPPGVRPTVRERLDDLQARAFATHPPLEKRIVALHAQLGMG